MAIYFKKEEFSERKSKVIKELKKQHLDGLLMFRQESMYWLTGYDTFGYVYFQCLVLTAKGDLVLLTRAPDLRQAQNTSIIKDIRIWVDKDKSNPADELKNILSELSLEKTKLEIKNLKQKIIQDSIDISNKLKSNQEEIEIEIDENVLDDKILKTVKNTKIKIHKSNFYKSLSKDEKIQKVSTQILNNDGRPISKERVVQKNEFKNYFYKEESLDPKYLTNVELEIISPVLKNNKISWRALYEGSTISFIVKDKDFKDLIINKGLSFSNGTRLLCDLEIKLKIDSNGETKEGNKTVYNVTQIKYPNGDIVDL